MSCNTKLYIAQTQHFDILWRKELNYYRDIQKRVITRVIEIIREYPDFRFTLSQVNVLRTFAENNPDLAGELKEYIRRGNIEVAGGSESLPDLNMSSGESLLRNFIYGRKWIEEFCGVKPTVGSLLDAFGTNGQIPQILAKSGYSTFLAGRMPGSGLDKKQYSTCFVWKGIDGTPIQGINISYDNVPEDDIGVWYGWGELEGFDAKYDIENPTPDPKTLEKMVTDGLSHIKSMSSSDKELTVMCGEMHLPRPEIAKQVIEEFNKQGGSAKFASFSEYASQINWNNGVEHLSGEYNVEFSGCYTSRINVKQESQKAEYGLYNAEFLSAIAKACGYNSDNYNNLLPLWRDLFVCQFHDALCGCHIDENYGHIMDAFARISSGVDESLETSLNALSNSYSKTYETGCIAVWNTLPFKRNDIVRLKTDADTLRSVDGKLLKSQRDGEDLVFENSVSGGGCSRYRLETEHPSPIQNLDVFPAEGIPSGRFFVADSNCGPCIEDTVRCTDIFNKESVAAAIRIKHDVGDMWTEEFTGEELTEAAGDSKLVCVETGPVFVKAVYAGKFDSSRTSWDGLKELSWTKTFFIYKGLDRIDLHIDLDYSGKGTEISVLMPMNLSADSFHARYEIPFGSLERKPYADGTYKYGKGNWPALTWCDVSDDKTAYCVVHTGTPGCKAENGTLSYSLLRSAVGHSEPLFPVIPDGMSFDNGKHHYEFSIIPHDPCGTEWLRQARQFVVKPVISKSPMLPDAQSFSIEIRNPNIVLSSLKPAMDGNGLIMRLYEILGQSCTTMVSTGFEFSSVHETSFDETQEGPEVDFSEIQFKPYEIRTFRIELP